MNINSLIKVIIASLVGGFLMLFSFLAHAETPNVSKSLKPKVYQTGIASYYHKKFHGRLTANGERYNHYGPLTAAHKTLPFGTIVRVTDLKSKKSVVVRINDRGPFVRGRVIDLNYTAASKLGLTNKGLAKVSLTILSKPSRPQTFHHKRIKK